MVTVSRQEIQLLAARTLGWRATTGLEAGIGKFAEWLTSEGEMQAHYRAALATHEELP